MLFLNVIEELYMMVVYTIKLTKILKEVANITIMHAYVFLN